MLGSLWLLGIFVLGCCSVLWAPQSSDVAAWWPAAGLSVAGLVLAGRDRHWLLVLGVVVVSGAAYLAGGRSLSVSVCFGVAHGLEALVVARWLQAGRAGRPTLASLEDLGRLLSGAMLGAALTGSIVALTVHRLLDGPFPSTWATVTASHAAAILILVPLAMQTVRQPIRQRAWEVLGQWSVTLTCTFLVFQHDQHLPLAFLLMPLLVWGTLRHGIRSVSVQLLAVGMIATALTARGGGPFAPATSAAGETAALVQLFLIAGALVVLTLAVTATQRRRALDRMSTSEDAAHRERKFTVAVLDTTGCAIVVLDVDGRVVRFNRAAERLSGRTAADVRGSPLWEILPPPDRRGEVEELFGDIAATGVPLDYEDDWLDQDGERHRIIWSNSYLTGPGGERSHVVMTGIDVTEERRASSRFTGVVEAATGTAIVGTDLTGTLTLFNPGAELVSGYAAEEVVGKADATLLLDAGEVAERAEELGMKPGMPVLIPHLVDGRSPEVRDWSVVCKNGERRLLSMTISIIRDPSGRAVGFLGVGEDVTDRRRVEQLTLNALAREREVVERLQDLDRVKTEFVSSVSHELRTPITSVIGYTEMLQEGVAGEVTADQAGILDKIGRNGQRLQRLIEDLLTLSRIEAGTFTMQSVPLDLTEVVAHAHEVVAPMLSGRALPVTLELPDTPVALRGDPEQLERAVVNLLSNAVKFTPDGGRVTLRLEQHGRIARIVVTDTGIGIPEREQNRLFSRFFRSSTAHELAIQGTGLGLSIVHTIVSGHAGHVDVISEPGVGSTFAITLPMHERQPLVRDDRRSNPKFSRR